MSTYETLIKKANECREAAKNTRGYMSTIWLVHALELEAKAEKLSLKQIKK